MKRERYAQVFLETTSQCGMCKEPLPVLLDRGMCKQNVVGKTSLKKFWIPLIFLPPLGRRRPSLPGLRQPAGLPA